MDVQSRGIAYRIDDGRCAGDHRALRNALGAVGPGRFALFDKVRLQTGHFRGPEGPVTVQAAVSQLPCRVKGQFLPERVAQPHLYAALQLSLDAHPVHHPSHIMYRDVVRHRHRAGGLFHLYPRHMYAVGPGSVCRCVGGHTEYLMLLYALGVVHYLCQRGAAALRQPRPSVVQRDVLRLAVQQSGGGAPQLYRRVLRGLLHRAAADIHAPAGKVAQVPPAHIRVRGHAGHLFRRDAQRLRHDLYLHHQLSVAHIVGAGVQHAGAVIVHLDHHAVLVDLRAESPAAVQSHGPALADEVLSVLVIHVRPVLPQCHGPAHAVLGPGVADGVPREQVAVLRIHQIFHL